MKINNTFLGYLSYSIRKLLTYRIYIISEIIGSLLLPIVLNYFIWKSLLQTNTIGYSLNEMMRYIIISNVILLFTQIRIEGEIEKDIKTYRLGQKLLLPVGYIKDNVFRYISNGIVRFTIIYMPIIIITSNRLPRNLIHTCTFLIIGFLLNALLSFIIGFLSFWMTEIWGVAAIRNLSIGLLSGATFPLDILPISIQRIMLFTPFPYMTYIPSKLICDPHFSFEIVKKGFFIASTWMAIFYLIAFTLMKHGLEKYTSNGV